MKTRLLNLTITCLAMLLGGCANPGAQYKTEDVATIISKSSKYLIRHVDGHKVGGYWGGHPKQIQLLPGKHVLIIEHESVERSDRRDSLVENNSLGLVGAAAGLALDNVTSDPNQARKIEFDAMAGMTYYLKSDYLRSGTAGVRIWLESKAGKVVSRSEIAP